jgi:hypothetical protein
MINLLKWQNAELDEKPDLDVDVLVVGTTFDGFATARYTNTKSFKFGSRIYEWMVQPFGTPHFYTKNGVSMWAYLPSETEENIPDITNYCLIQFFNGKEWADLPHKKITSPEEAYRTIHELGEIPAFKATRFRVIGHFKIYK